MRKKNLNIYKKILIFNLFMSKQKWALIAVLFFAVAGMALGLFLTDYHYKLLANQETTHTVLCTLSSSFNCDIVNSSPYAELFGVPIALWGFFFYLTLFCIAGIALFAKQNEKLVLLLHGMALFSVLYSIYLFYIAEFVIGALCPYCIIMYGVNISLLLLTKIAVQKTYKEMWAMLHRT